MLTSLLMSGFMNANTITEQQLTIEAIKPSHKADAAAIPSNKTNQNKQSIWKLSANDFNDNAYELEDEDALLDDDVNIKPSAGAFDCGTDASKKKRACKNCACGLKELLEEEEKKASSNGGIFTSYKCLDFALKASFNSNTTKSICVWWLLTW